MVSIPTSYDKTDPVQFDSVIPGGKVSPAALQRMAANYNFARGYHVPVVAPAFHPAGIVSPAAAGTFRDLLIWEVPECLDRPGLTAAIIAKHTGSGVDGTLRLDCGGSTADATVLTTTTAYTLHTISCGTPASGDFAVYFRSDSPEVTVCWVELYWTPITGTVSGAQTIDGFEFIDASELAADEPVTVHQLNQLLTGPQQIRKSRPAVAWSWADLVTQSNATMRDTNGVAGTSVGNVCVFARYACTLRWRAFTVGPTGSTLDIVDTTGGAGSVTLAESHTTKPTNPGGAITWKRATMAVTAGVHIFSLTMVSGTPATPFDLWSLLATVEV